jgi:hypothetical protein
MTELATEPNTAYQAYHQYPAYSSSPSMYPSAAGPATFTPSGTVDESTSVLTIKTIRCEWNKCFLMMNIATGRERESVRAHFEQHHIDVLHSRSAREERYCLWKDCRCLCRRGGRCVGRLRGHTAHAHNIFHHMWHAHVKDELKK